MNEQGKSDLNTDLNTVLEKTQLTLGDIMATAYQMYQKDNSLLSAKIIFSFDTTNGNLDCCVWKSDTEVYSLFSNDSADPRNKDFQVIAKVPLSEEDRKIVAKAAEGLKPNTVKRVNLDEIREKVRTDAKQK